jgi:Tfp pilus assembly protein FimT
MLEMSLVLALIVIVASITYPSVDSFYRGLRVRAGADAIRAACTLARVHAMDEGRPYRVAILPGKGNYRVAPDGPEHWSGGSKNQTDGDTAHAIMIHEEALPSGVIFVTDPKDQAHPDGKSAEEVGSVDPAHWSTLATLAPDGTAEHDKEFTLRYQGTAPITLQLRALTGIVSIRQPGTEDNR